MSSVYTFRVDMTVQVLAENEEQARGLPEGHVTGHGLRPAQELKALGNGVVPQQALLALRLLLGHDNALPVSEEGAA